MRMKVLITTIFLVLCIVLSACEGPTGPQGPPGESTDIKVYQGSLTENALVDSLYWEIEVGQDLGNWLVVTMVRESEDYAWFEPLWDILELDNGLSTVAIYQDEVVTAGYEYRIAVIE